MDGWMDGWLAGWKDVWSATGQLWVLDVSLQNYVNFTWLEATKATNDVYQTNAAPW